MILCGMLFDEKRCGSGRRSLLREDASAFAEASADETKGRRRNRALRRGYKEEGGERNMPYCETNPPEGILSADLRRFGIPERRQPGRLPYNFGCSTAAKRRRYLNPNDSVTASHL